MLADVLRRATSGGISVRVRHYVGNPAADGFASSDWTVADIPIAEVDLSRSIILGSPMGAHGSVNNPATGSLVWGFLNPTTVRVEREGANQNPRVAFMVVEFSAVKSLQVMEGSYVNADHPLLLTIDSVDPEKTLLASSNTHDSSSSFENPTAFHMKPELDNATTLRLQAQRISGHTGGKYRAFVVEL